MRIFPTSTPLTQEKTSRNLQTRKRLLFSQEDLIKITELILSELAKGLAEKNITMTVSDGAKELIVKKGYDKKFGARPIRRVILREIEDVIASKIISGEIKEGRNICIDSANNIFVII